MSLGVRSWGNHHEGEEVSRARAGRQHEMLGKRSSTTARTPRIRSPN